MSEVFVDIENKKLNDAQGEGMAYTNFSAVAIGNGSKVFRGDSSGIWLGAEKWASAPFRVDMDGNLTATSLTITGYVATGGAAADVNAGVTTINASKVNITGSTNFAAGYNPTTKLESIGGIYTTTSVAAAAKVQIFPDVNTGIIAYTSDGATVVFKVEVGGTNVGDVTIGNYAGGSGMLWDQSAGTLYIKGNLTAGEMSANRITSGTLNIDRIPSITVDKLSVTTLSSITANMGTITAGSITGATITGGTFRTSASGQRVVLDTSNILKFYSATALRGQIYGGDSDPYNGLVLFADNVMLSPDGGQIYLIGNTSHTDGTFYCNSLSMQNGIDMNSNSITELNQVAGSTGNIDFNSSGALKVSTHTDFSGNIKSNHHSPNSNKAYNLGGDTLAWDYVYADDYVTKSAGWYDEGVTMQNGEKVSDMEGLRRIKPHTRMFNKNGSAELDFTTLPIEILRSAIDDSNQPLPRNEFGDALDPLTGKVVGDGVSITHLVSVIMGALKEVDSRVILLEKGTK